MTYTIIIAIVDELFPVVAPWEADSRDHAIVSVCEWIAAGAVPVDGPGQCVRLLPASAIDGFDVGWRDETDEEAEWKASLGPNHGGEE